MTSLDNKIKAQYSSRDQSGDLYDSDYSKLADEERLKTMKEMLGSVSHDSTIIEIGAGQGGNVPMLEACGFKTGHIFLNELLPDRIKMAEERFPQLKMYPGNVLDIDFKKQFDFVFQSTVFTSILDDSDRKKVAEKMWQILKPGGSILWYDFVYNNPLNRNVRKVSLHELKTLFPDSVKTTVRRVTLAPPIGRRVGKLYKVFNVPFLRTHIFAVIRKS